MKMSKIGIMLTPEDGWPPYDVEHILVDIFDALYEVKNVPFFIKGLSLGDIISAEIDDDGYAEKCSIVKESTNSTIWIITGDENISDILSKLGCTIEGGAIKDMYSINVPKSVEMKSVDSILAPYVKQGTAQVAYPSYRHEG
jgi:hypothetical protein